MIVVNRTEEGIDKRVMGDWSICSKAETKKRQNEEMDEKRNAEKEPE